MIPHYELFIDGKFIDSEKRDTLINPSTAKPLATVAVATREHIEMAISSCRNAFDRGEWKKVNLEEQKKILLKISRKILERASELAKLESLNTGKPIKESTFMDIPSSAGVFEYFANNLEKFLEKETFKINSQIASIEAKLIYEPYGVCLLIVPWNYPLLLASWKLAQALAAKNTVILKPSSLTPLSVLELAKIVADILPKGVVNIINAKGDTIGEYLCSDNRIDMISFTGSNSIGKKILEYSAKSIKKLIMELGGKSAGIILSDADLELAVNGSLCSIFLNQGQMCTAISRIFVQEDIYDAFVDDFVKKTERIKLGDSLDFQTQMGALISESHRQKVINFVEEAKKQNVELLSGGEIPQDENLKDGFFFKPTIFINVKPTLSIFKDEIFGPIVCINKFSTIKEAIFLANSSDFALAASLWTKNINLAEEIAGEINAGIIWINTYGMFLNELPYGGFKQSGFGKELGKAGFLEYCRLKNIIIDTQKETKPIVNYWYGF